MGRRYHYKDSPMDGSNEEFDDIWRKLDALSIAKSVSVQATVGTTETEIRHNLGKIPTSVIPVPRTQATVRQTRNPNEKSIFLEASVDAVCDIRIE